MELKELFLGKLNESFSSVWKGVLRDQGRFCVPNVYGFRNRILEEAHESHYSIH